jgi:hypothetical protein
MRGLIGRRAPRALLLPRTRSVHSFGLTEPIDAVLLDDELRVVEIVRLRPRRLLLPRAHVRHVLEVGRSPFERGDVLRIGDGRSGDQEPEELEDKNREEGKRRDGPGEHPSGPSGKGDRLSVTGRCEEAE